MAWDTEGTKQRILAAAKTEFAQFGPAGTTIDRIAKVAGANKERVYNYFGDKLMLFSTVLRNEMALVAQALPIESFASEDIGDYAGHVYDYHQAHPELSRLLRWESLAFDDSVPNEAQRQAHYGYKVLAVAEGQRQGMLTDAMSAEHLIFMVLALASWWSTVPQVARMLVGPMDEQAHERCRQAVVLAARRLAAAP